MPSVKLLVTDSDKCIKLLKYLDENIESFIKATKFFVDITKVDSESLTKEVGDALKRKGIVSLPALIDPDGNVTIGCVKIMDMIDCEINKGAPQTENRTAINDMGVNPALTDFWGKEMFDVKNGVIEPRKDDDDPQAEDRADLDTKLRNYRAPQHRTVPSKTYHQGGQDNQGNRDETPDIIGDQEDNVGEAPHGNLDRYIVGKQPGGRKDLDQQMMDAWLANAGSDQ